jgi:inner membrane protein
MRTFLAKSLTLLGITFLLMLGLFKVDGMVDERLQYRQQAIAEVSNGLSGAQTLAGPMLMLPYQEQWKESKFNEQLKLMSIEDRVDHRRLWLLPESLDISGKINPDFRKRGLFKVAGYESKLILKGHFLLPTELPKAENVKTGRVLLEEGALAMVGVKDPRGIRSLKMSLNGEAINFEPGTAIAEQSGAQAKLKTMELNGARLDFEMELDLAGAESLVIVPLGKATQTTLNSPWPHPSFYGSFLPVEREVTDNGFTATWKVSNLANDARDRWLRNLNHPGATKNTDDLYASVKSYGVRILEPVNTYSLTDRAIKYGLLFIASTIAVFALFELLKQLQVHPLQYLMIGMALVLFFVLLLSLSEQFGFAKAYACAASACILLITYYSRYVLKGWRAAGMIGGQLSFSFGGLYGLLHSEQNALLIGSIILFAMLAAIMVGTRNVNWFEKFTALGPVKKPLASDLQV